MTSALHFSVMCEDPEVEIQALPCLQNAKCLFICSAGCVAMSVLEARGSSISHVCLLDNNTAQLNYVRDRISGVVKCRPTGTYDTVFQELLDTKCYDTVFSHSNLTDKFGAAAVQHSTQSFVKYFKEHVPIERVADLQCRWREYNIDHRFLQKSEFRSDHRFLQKSEFNIEFVHADVCEYFRHTEKWDLISLSNVTDWIDNPTELLRNVRGSLSTTGKLVTRRLNSDTPLYEALQKNNYHTLAATDSTGLYQEVYVSSL
jgi:S-adenosylmethionine:diacylglycerol 3-amino-3-carboxypropyl transferase